MLFYTLVAGKINRVTEPEWADWFENNNTLVETTKLDGVQIQTVFHGLIMGDLILADPPVWATNVKGGPLHDVRDTCGGTETDARAMHTKMVYRVSTLLNQPRTN